jgi:lipooligosaccharide transport system permease protein
VFCGAAVAALVTAFTATVTDEGSAFTLVFRLVLIPMTLFSGTFFPVDRLPGWTLPVVWASPLWHGTELARAATLGGDAVGAALPVLGHVGYLLALLALGTAVAVRQFRKRLHP